MKNIFKLLTMMMVLMLAIVSCELDRFPYSGIEQSQSFLTIEDARTHRNGLYSLFRARNHGIYQYSTEIQSDWLNATLDFGNRNGNPHRWTDFIDTDYTIRDVWRFYYNAISNANNLIENLPSITTESAAEEAELARYIGEAHFMRAYYYHNLVQRWGKTYDPATAATDPGVPLVTTYDINLMPERASVADVYQQIMDDLTEAATRLADFPGTPMATRVTKDAVTAMQARVYLCMRNWTAAVTAANSLIGSTTYILPDDQDEINAMWLNDNSTEIIFQPFVSITEGAPTNIIYTRFDVANDYYNPDWVPTQDVVDLFDDTDYRKEAYFIEYDVRIQGFTYPDIFVFNKYPGNPALYTGATPNGMHKPKIFRLAEMYLISAEAAAMTPATEGDALTTLNNLRVTRNLPALVGLTGNDLRDAIREERTRELLGEGFRLDDLRRWGLGFSRGTPQNLSFIETGEDYEQKTVTADNPKFVWGIPARDMTINPNLKGNQNPGW